MLRVDNFSIYTLPPAFVFLLRWGLRTFLFPRTPLCHCELVEVPFMVTELGWWLWVVDKKVRNLLSFVGSIREIAAPNEVVPFGSITYNLFKNRVYNR